MAYTVIQSSGNTYIPTGRDELKIWKRIPFFFPPPSSAPPFETSFSRKSSLKNIYIYVDSLDVKLANSRLGNERNKRQMIIPRAQNKSKISFSFDASFLPGGNRISKFPGDARVSR